MKFVVTKSSDWDYREEVEINTLEEMKDFQIQAQHSLIVSFYAGTIEIYDDYRE